MRKQSKGSNCDGIPGPGLDGRLCSAIVVQSPVSTWIADRNGTLIYANEACKRLFGIERDEEVVGKYNILKDEELARQGFLPEVKRVFESGGSVEITVDYDFSRVKHVKPAHPTHRTLRGFLFAITGDDGRVANVVVQHEDYTERVEAEHALAVSEARFRELVEEISDWVWQVDLDARYTYSSPSVRDILGYTPDEVIGSSLFDYIIAEDQPKCRKVFGRAVADKSQVVRVLHRNSRKDGTIVYLEASCRPIISGDGKLAGLRGVDRDVTDRVKALEALRESEEKFRKLADNASVAIGIIQGRRFVYANPYMEKLTGYTHEELLSVDIGPLIHPEDRDVVLQRARARHLGKPAPLHYEFRMVRKNGEARWLDMSLARIEYGGASAIAGVAYDITERKRAADALRESERKLRSVFVSALEAIVIADDSGRFVDANAAASALFGVPQRRLIGRSISDFMPPGFDFEAAWARLLQARKERGEVSIVRPDGTIRFAEFSGTAGILPGGNLLIWHDVTDRKEAERELSEAEAKYRSLVEESLVGVYIIQDGRFSYVNPRCAEIFGYSRQEIVRHKTVMDLVAPEDRALVAENLRKRLEGEIESIRYEFRGLRKDGTIIDVAVLGSRTVYEGRPAVIGSLLDITERKAAERRRAELEADRRDFYRRTILAATENKLVICEADEICTTAGSSLASWKITSGKDLSRIRHEIGDIARSVGMDEGRVYDFVLAAGEATTNAFKHAGGGTASVHRLPDGLMVVVSDRGPGIAASSLPEVALVRGYSTAGTLGMGYKAILSVADRAYLATGPGGTTVAIQMSLHSQEEDRLRVLGISDAPLPTGTCPPPGEK